MNYALSKRNLLLQVLYAFTRFYLYYQDELQMEKCLMEYSLTSLFSILLFPQWALLVENCLGYIVDSVLRKKMKNYVTRKCQTCQSLFFFVLIWNAKLFSFNRNICWQCLLQSLAIYYSQKANQFSFLGKTKLKNNHVCNRQDPCKQISLVFRPELHTIDIYAYIEKYTQKYENICVFMCIYSMHTRTYKQLTIYLSLTHLTEVENQT